MGLTEYGWNDEWAAAFAPHAEAGYFPARVVCELRRKFYAVQDEEIARNHRESDQRSPKHSPKRWTSHPEVGHRRRKRSYTCY